MTPRKTAKSKARNQSTSLIRTKVERHIAKELDKKDKSGRRIEGLGIRLDWTSEKLNTVCEIYARIGALKPGQVNKVMKDALRLVYAAKLRQPKKTKCVLAFCDREAADPFQDGSGKWMATVLKSLDIKVKVVEIPPMLRRDL